MINIVANKISSNEVILKTNEFYKLIDKVKEIEEVNVMEVKNDLPVEGIMRLQELGGSFDFLNDPREDIYTIDDLKVRYK